MNDIALCIHIDQKVCAYEMDGDYSACVCKKKCTASATKWRQLIVGSSFAVILAKKWPPSLGIGVG